MLLGDFNLSESPGGFVLTVTRGVVVSGASGFELASSGSTTVSAITSSSVQGRVTVTVNGPPNSPLPPHSNARVTAQLVDVSLQDVSASVLATQTIVGADGPHGPWEFSLTYDPSEIDASGRYAVQVRVEVGDELWFVTDESHLVITGGNPTDLDITLASARE